MENNKNINWGWILTAVFFISFLFLLLKLKEAEVQIANKNKTLDSLLTEAILLEDKVEIREEEVRILEELNKDDFDRLEKFYKLERLLKEE